MLFYAVFVCSGSCCPISSFLVVSNILNELVGEGFDKYLFYGEYGLCGVGVEEFRECLGYIG